MSSSSFPANAEVGVGFSNQTLWTASVVGFVGVAAVLYFSVFTRVKTAEELEDEDENLTHEQQLARRDVSQLNRAERRARAHYLMKQQRRQQQQGEAAEGASPTEATRLQGSRKERQKAAKALEKAERQQNQAERQKQQEQAQKEAAKDRLRRKEEAAVEAALEKERQQAEAERKRQAEELAYHTFLSTSEKAMTVDEWVASLTTTSRLVDIKKVAIEFETSEQGVHDRIATLVNEDRVTGILEPARFIYLSDEELAGIADQVEGTGFTTLNDIASICNKKLSQRLG